MGDINNSGNILPTDEVFRGWVSGSINALQVDGFSRLSATQAGHLSGLGTNTLTAYMGEKSKTITLRNAMLVQKFLFEQAKERNVLLPKLGGSQNG